MNQSLLKALQDYEFEGNITNIDIITNGNINKTFIVTCDNSQKYLFQKINTNVFKEPFILMKNIENITTHINNYYNETGDTFHKSLHVVRTKDNGLVSVIKDELGERNYFRVYNFIDNSISYNKSEDPKIVYNTGVAFGNFVKVLNGYPMDEVEETIKDFHNTPKRYEALIKSIKDDPVKRSREVAPEIVYFLQNEDEYSIITKGLKSGTIPYRVTHNDTKVNNVMLDKVTNEFLAVIDLDTVMPGSCLYDYGDAVRSVCAKTYEDDENLDNVGLQEELFEKFTEGYLSQTIDLLTKDELKYLALSAKIITNELAMRFLQDYINGDTYFKVNYEKHNLVRARNQIQMAKDLENKMDYMTDTIDSISLKLKKK